MRYTGPKNKLARREGIDLGLKTTGSKSHSGLLRRLNIMPGQHSTFKKRRKMTDFGIQLRQKQRLKKIYGVTEKQLKNYFLKAAARKGNTAESLLSFLETRLDNVVYKSGLSPTRSAARQLVFHGHILVNEKKVDIPSVLLQKGDVISLKSKKSLEIPYIKNFLERSDVIIPKWLEKKGTHSKISREPTLEDFPEPIDLQSVIEFYSR